VGNTYQWNDALTVVKPYIKSIPTTTIDVTVCDQLNSYIWRRYPWRWAQASLTSASGVLSLVDGQQDYGIGTLSGGGFYQMLRIRITRTDVTPFTARDKDWTNFLAPCLDLQGSIDSIQALALEPVTNKIRLDRAASVPSGTTYQIDGEYWMLPTKVTTTSSTLPFDDQYFDVAIEGLKWRYYAVGDDKREPTQKSVFLGLLQEMVAQEDYADAPGTRFPEMGIGVTRAGNPGLFGWQG